MKSLTFILFVLLSVIVVLSLLFVKKQTQNQLKAQTAKAMVITCMDFRLIDDAVKYLNAHGYNNNYDEFILAGASLGYNQTKFAAWTESLDKHIELAKQLHQIKEVIVIDHMNCGAYKLLYDKKTLSETEETVLHQENFVKFKETIKTKYPDLTVKTLLMKLNGEVVEFE